MLRRSAAAQPKLQLVRNLSLYIANQYLGVGYRKLAQQHGMGVCRVKQIVYRERGYFCPT